MTPARPSPCANRPAAWRGRSRSCQRARSWGTTRLEEQGRNAGAVSLALPAGFARAAAVELRYGNAGTETSLSNIFNKKLSQAMAAKTNGELSMEIFAGSLGGEQKLLDSISLGSLDVYNGAYTGTREFNIFYAPGFFRDGVQAKAVIESEIGQKASAMLGERYGARLLGVGRLGGYNLMLRKPITSLSELKGLEIRSANIEGCIEGLRHFGAIPTPIPFNEIYLALQQGSWTAFSPLSAPASRASSMKSPPMWWNRTSASPSTSR